MATMVKNNMPIMPIAPLTRRARRRGGNNGPRKG